ncbi:MAG: phosphoribosyltransferase family protein [Dehalococcoidales bacterium]|nr:phosphoribosyltransferase family protein [Dehalococcoidales bacterium]
MTVKKTLFENRSDAGRQLAAKLNDYAEQPVVVLAIPNGGVPVALEVARTLNADFDVVVARKIPMPLYPESGFGAITDDGSALLNIELVKRTGLNEHQIELEVDQVRAEVKRRILLYRGNRPLVSVHRKTVIIVDDGLASGATMMAAVDSVRQRQPGEIVVAVPCASMQAKEQVEKTSEKVITCVVANAHAGFAVADYYHYWSDVKDADVIRMLDEWQAHQLQSRYNLAYPEHP